MSERANLRGQLQRHEGGAAHSPAHSLEPAGLQIEYKIARSAGDVVDVHFALHGDVGGLCLPPWSRALRADGLWHHSCFELFIGPVGAASYCEFNFAPTGGWAAYQFSSTREGMQNLPGIGNPLIEIGADVASYNLRAKFALGRVDALAAAHVWRLGVAVIIEDKDGSKSYWALAHPPGKANFHHETCFAQTLKRPDAL